MSSRGIEGNPCRYGTHFPVANLNCVLSKWQLLNRFCIQLRGPVHQTILSRLGLEAFGPNQVQSPSHLGPQPVWWSKLMVYREPCTEPEDAEVKV